MPTNLHGCCLAPVVDQLESDFQVTIHERQLIRKIDCQFSSRFPFLQK